MTINLSGDTSCVEVPNHNFEEFAEGASHQENMQMIVENGPRIDYGFLEQIAAIANRSYNRSNVNINFFLSEFNSFYLEAYWIRRISI